MNNLAFDSLPGRVLSREQEDALVPRIAAGDEDARNELVLNNIREAVVYSRRCCDGKITDDELISLCYHALTTSARHFKTGYGRFFAYAKASVRGDVKGFWRTLHIVRNGKCISDSSAPPERVQREFVIDSLDFDYTGKLEHGHSSRFIYSEEKVSTDPEFPAIYFRDEWSRIEPIIAGKLLESERMVLNLAYKAQLNFQEIGRLLDIGRSAVQRTHAQAVKKIRIELRRQGRLLKDRQ